MEKNIRKAPFAISFQKEILSMKYLKKNDKIIIAVSGGMDSIARGMVESKEPTDLLDEKKLFTTNAEVQNLLEGLFTKDKKHETQ